MMKKMFSAIALLSLTLAAFTACGDDDDNSPKTILVAAVDVQLLSSALEIGETVQLKASVLPSDADDTSVTWSSANTAVATVDAATGLVTAVGAGEVNITATANDAGKVSGFCPVKVNEPVVHTVAIAGDGFDMAEVRTILESEAGKTPVKVNIAASGGVDKLMVGITSSSAAFNGALAELGMAQQVDLANLDEVLAEVLGGMGLPVGAAVKGETELPFDITGFMSMIFLVTEEEGGDVTAAFTLTASDAYENSASATLSLKLVRTTQLKNAGFEDWSSRNNSSTGAVTTWYPYSGYPETTARFWDTANQGLNLAGNVDHRNLTAPKEEARTGSTGTKSAVMNSRYVKVLTVNKFAAGNLFVGAFGALNIGKGGASVYFGQPFTARPKSLKGWMKSNSGTIDYAGEGSPKAVGDKDEYSIFIALTTWAEPHLMETWTPATFFSPTMDGVIGYGGLTGSDAVSDWKEFSIPVAYTSEATPTHIVVVATSSRYGDYFTGSTESWLQLDDVELVY